MQWINWLSHEYIPVPYYYWLGIRPPTTPRILARNPRWSHSGNHKQICATQQGGKDKIWYHQSLWWRPEATYPGSLPEWLCVRSRKYKCWIHTDHKNRTNESFIWFIWNHQYQWNGGRHQHHGHTIWYFQDHHQVVHPNWEGITNFQCSKHPIQNFTDRY